MALHAIGVSIKRGVNMKPPPPPPKTRTNNQKSLQKHHQVHPKEKIFKWPDLPCALISPINKPLQNNSDIQS